MAEGAEGLDRLMESRPLGGNLAASRGPGGWVITDDRMAGMDAGPGTDPATLGFWVTAWVVMMAAMMFPSIAPMVVMHARIEQGKRRQGTGDRAGSHRLFVGGYLLTWTAAGWWATCSLRRARRFRWMPSPGIAPDRISRAA